MKMNRDTLLKLIISALLTQCITLSLAHAATVETCVVDNAKDLGKALQWAHFKKDYPEDFYGESSTACEKNGRSLITIKGSIDFPYPITLKATWGIELRGIESAELHIKSAPCAIEITTKDNIVTQLTVENDYGSGICIKGTANTVDTNSIIAYGAGISINKNGHTITNNKVTNAGYFGFAYESGDITCVHSQGGNSVVTEDGPGFNACTPVVVVDPVPEPEPSPEPKPEPTPKKDDGPKCSANQYLFGGTLCCDLTTEVPDPLSQTCKKKVLTTPPPPPAPAIIPPVGEVPGQSANGESNCTLRPGSADSTPRIAFGSAWLIVLGALLLVIIRSQADHHHNRRGHS